MGLRTNPDVSEHMECADWSLRFRLWPCELKGDKEHYKKVALEYEKGRLDMAMTNLKAGADERTCMMSEKTCEDNIYLKYNLEA